MDRIDFVLTEKDRGGSVSTSFSGRTEGRTVRKLHNVDKMDSDDNNYYIKMPQDTSSFNPSFFLGLFFPSIKQMGMDKFKKKYEFFYDNLYEGLGPIIKDNISECYRRAYNELNGVTALDEFLKK